MGRKLKVSKDAVVDALQRSHGLKTGAAELLGVSFMAIDRYCNRYPDAQLVVDHWRKRRVDRAEYKLDEALERGEAWAIALVLKSARDREYNDRIKVEMSWRDEAIKRGYDPDQLFRDMVNAARRRLAESTSGGSVADGDSGNHRDGTMAE